MSILIATLALGGLGAAFAAVLAVFFRRFAVKQDPKTERVLAALPGSNCGACGFAGCQGLTDALLEGKVEVTGCVAGGEAVARALGEIMGVAVNAGPRQVAYVACQGGTSRCGTRFRYIGIEDCQAAALQFGGNKVCTYGCLGMGSCVRVCPFDAIHINDERIAEVDRVKCKACKKCLAACPKKIISMVPASQQVFVACSNLDRGRKAKDACLTACIACKICEKNCPEQAIVVNANNLAVIDFDKCRQHAICVAKCPQKSIVTLAPAASAEPAPEPVAAATR
jgi:Na+-translocating ferredoxin:NAD+ oxidoreductase RNF subunit RnfB